MNKVELALNAAQLMLKVTKDIRILADSIQAVCTTVTESLSEEDERNLPKAKEKKPNLSLEKVRGVLADKSRSGFTAEVRAIIVSHGADRLSGIDPAEYEAVLKEAEALGNE